MEHGKREIEKAPHGPPGFDALWSERGRNLKGGLRPFNEVKIARNFFFIRYLI